MRGGNVYYFRYLKRNTTIPVARVHGYGPGGPNDINNPTALPYLILEYMPGKPLDPKEIPA